MRYKIKSNIMGKKEKEEVKYIVNMFFRKREQRE